MHTDGTAWLNNLFRRWKMVAVDLWKMFQRAGRSWCLFSVQISVQIFDKPRLQRQILLGDVRCAFLGLPSATWFNLAGLFLKFQQSNCLWFTHIGCSSVPFPRFPMATLTACTLVSLVGRMLFLHGIKTCHSAIPFQRVGPNVNTCKVHFSKANTA